MSVFHLFLLLLYPSYVTSYPCYIIIYLCYFIVHSCYIISLLYFTPVILYYIPVIFLDDPSLNLPGLLKRLEKHAGKKTYTLWMDMLGKSHYGWICRVNHIMDGYAG